MKMKPFKKKPKKARSDNMRRRPVNYLASMLTTMNLYCGVASIFATIGYEFKVAALFIFAGILFDTLDGFVARLTKSNSLFGQELDSLCDVVTFGVAPAVMIFVAYLPEHATPVPSDILIGGGAAAATALQEIDLPNFATPLTGFLSSDATSIVGKTGSYMGIIYAICTALRLARFNSFQASRRDVFIGLPSPAAGATIASFILLLEYYTPRLETYVFGSLATFALGPLAVVLAFLMISNVQYPKDKFKSFVFSPLHAYHMLAVTAVGLAFLHYAITQSPAIVLFPMCMAYVLFGLTNAAYTFLKGDKQTVEMEKKEKAQMPAESPLPPPGVSSTK
jgi:CDP-diacylglycerol--serine O-phosphatidyltransferase